MSQFPSGVHGTELRHALAYGAGQGTLFEWGTRTSRPAGKLLPTLRCRLGCLRAPHVRQLISQTMTQLPARSTCPVLCRAAGSSQGFMKPMSSRRRWGEGPGLQSTQAQARPMVKSEYHGMSPDVTKGNSSCLVVRSCCAQGRCGLDLMRPTQHHVCDCYSSHFHVLVASYMQFYPCSSTANRSNRWYTLAGPVRGGCQHTCTARPVGGLLCSSRWHYCKTAPARSLCRAPPG